MPAIFGTQQLKSTLCIDTRSLSLFRILLGLSLLYNLWIRASYLTEFWGGNPIIPLPIFQQLNGQSSFSFFDLIRSDTFAYSWFIITALSMFFYTIGFRTRWIAPITCFLYWNILQAGSSFAFGFDFYTFQLLFWSCFLPVNNHFSINPKSDKQPFWLPNRLFCFILLYQIAWVYFATGMAKYGVSWTGGYAVHNMLQDKWATTSMGTYLAGKYWFYMPATYLSLWMEFFMPILIFLPFKVNAQRYLVVFFLFFFHLSILVTYHVANFSLSGIAVAALLLPTHFWKQLIKKQKQVFDNKVFIRYQSYTKYLSLGLVVLAFWVISWKNIFFIFRYSCLHESTLTKSFLKNASLLEPPTLIKTSFFEQHWKMFAPNPPAKVGWLALEIQKEDGFIYDLFSNKRISDTPKINWTPVGFEYYLLMYARNFDFPDHGGYKYKVFLKYWIPYKLHKNNLDVVSFDKLVFVNYLYLVAVYPPTDRIIRKTIELSFFEDFSPFRK